MGCFYFTTEFEQTSKRRFYWFSFNSWGIHLSSFFTFPICFRYTDTVEMLTPYISANSRTVVLGLLSTMVLKWALSTKAPRPIPLASSRHMSLFWNLWNQRLTVRSVVVFLPHALLTFFEVSKYRSQYVQVWIHVI